MTIASLHFGTENALERHDSSPDCVANADTLTSMADILRELAKDPPPQLRMLRSTCAQFAAYQNTAPEQITINAMDQNKGGFRAYLETRKYKENSVRTYVNFVRILLNYARVLGHDLSREVPEAWREVLALSNAQRCGAIALHLMRTRKDPRDVTIEDVNSWLAMISREGLAFLYAQKKTTHFWRILRECGCTNQNPMCFVREKRYGVRLRDFPPRMKQEVTDLLKWKCADYSIDRPKNGHHRAITSKFLQQVFCTLLGYALNIRNETQIGSIQELVRRDIVGGYVEWCINERKVKGGPLQRKLGVLWSALRHHPSFKPLDWGWLRSLADGIPIEHESELKARKAAKYLDYPSLESIAAQLCAERTKAEKDNPKRAALLCMYELLIRWLLTLPWRQRNVREMRISGSMPNLFRSAVPPFTPIDKPDWVVQEEQRNSAAEFWQFRFSPAETKTKIAPHALLPRQLTGILEEYLTKWRLLLVGSSDPGTLFVNRIGGRMTQLDIARAVSDLTVRYGGRRVTPHLFRDIVAFTWLKTHPQDYLTLSKLLWHSNVNTTIRIYGGRFNESSGVCAMEAWLDQRNSKALYPKASEDHVDLANIKPAFRANNVWSNHA